MKIILYVNLMALIAATVVSFETYNNIKLDNWMKYLPRHIKDMPLSEIAIPGSHVSMSYNISGQSKVGPDSDANPGIRFSINLFPENLLVAATWSRTQNLDTMEQLRIGIRFLDLRVAKEPSTNKFFFTHGLYSGQINKDLTLVKEFVDTHPEEVVILYFQYFYSFTDEDHSTLIDYLNDLFGQRLVPQPHDMLSLTINNLAKFNQSIILVYGHYINYLHLNLWNPSSLSSPWPDAQSTTHLLRYLKEINRPPGTFFVHQAVLSPSARFILDRIFATLLEKCAKPVLHDVLPILASDFSPGQVGHTKLSPVNIVMADFVDLENNLFPRTIIALNSKLHPPSEPPKKDT